MDPMFEYNKIREEIRSEYTLITGRLSWFVTSQSFLVSAFAISQANGFVWYGWFATLLLPMIGLLAALAALPPIVGACRTIELWHEKQDQFFARQPDFHTALSVVRKPWITQQGLFFPQVLPLLFVLFWLVIHVASYWLT